MKMRKTLSAILCLLLVATVFAVAVPKNVNSEDPEDPGLPEEPEGLLDDGEGWRIEGNGTYFELTNSTYLNITLTSSENVNIRLESVLKVISYHIKANCTATTTDIIMTGFEANKDYYRYQDGDLQDEFTADENGEYTYTQDISTGHHVFIQEYKSTIYIKSDGSLTDEYGNPITPPIEVVGTTYTLTDNIDESIYIQKSGITLDGNGFSIIAGSYTAYGLYLNYITDVIINNLTVQDFTYGFYLTTVETSTIEGCTVTCRYNGIRLISSESNTLNGNTISNCSHFSAAGICIAQYSHYNLLANNTVYGSSGTQSAGILLEGAGQNTLRNNVMTGNLHNFGIRHTARHADFVQDIDTSNTVDGKPIYYWVGRSYETVPADAGYVGIVDSHHITVEDVTISHGYQGILFADTYDSNIQNVSISYCLSGIWLGWSSRNNISGSTLFASGMGLMYSNYNTITGNTASHGYNYTYGIVLGDKSSYNNVSENTVTNNEGGIIIYINCKYNLIESNTVSVNRYGILIFGHQPNKPPKSNTIESNTLAGNILYGIMIQYSSYNILRNNTIDTTEHYSFGVWGGAVFTTYSSIEYYIHDIDTSNTINGRPIYYWVDHSHETVPTDAAYVGLVNSDNITVQNLTLDHIHQGVLLVNTHDSIIRNIDVYYTFWMMHLWLSCRNNITGNSFSKSDNGIQLCGDNHWNMINGNNISYISGTMPGQGSGIAGGIGLCYSDNNTIRWNNIERNSGFVGVPGIGVVDSHGNIIEENIMSSNNAGIVLRRANWNKVHKNSILFGYSKSYGIIMEEANDNEFSSNTIFSYYYGIQLQLSDQNIISDNNITNTRMSILLESSVNNIINLNIISTSYEYEFYVSSSSNNLIYHNNIIDDTIQAYDSDPANNNWHHPELLEGNYWSDYIGVDDGSGLDKHAIAGDRIGDTLIPHPDTDYDFYPFTEPDAWLNAPPVANADGPYFDYEGTEITFNAELSSDPDDDPLQYRWDFNDDGTWDTDWSESPTAPHTWLDDHLGTAKVEVSDGSLTDTAKANVTVLNADPIITSVISPLDPIQINMIVEISADFTDAGILDTHEAVIDWGDETVEPGDVDQLAGGGTVSGNHTYVTPDVYTVTLTVIDDDDGETSITTEYVVIYDPTGAFVTGGGMIDSPPGAFPADPDLIGKAGFGFVSKYHKGAHIPDGNTQFRFHAADINFQSDSYEWLVVAGPKAMFKGTGTINGEGNYGFLLSAIDGDMPGGHGIDKFRIKIWDKATGEIIYDNGLGAPDDADPASPLTHGSIKIHKA